MRNRSGFTLVELSIVLVIIGLLISGLLVGQSMISAAKITAQIKQLQQYDIGTSNFKVTYNQIPGDSNLGFNAGSCNFNQWTGNNNGYLDEKDTLNSPPQYMWYEPLLFFPQLSTAEMITEGYVCVPGTFKPGEGNQFPFTKISSKGAIMVTGQPNGDIYYLVAVSDIDGATYHYTQAFPDTGGFLAPTLALALDVKLDDGLPGSGEVLAINQSPDTAPYPFELDIFSGAPRCTNAGVSYNLDSTDTRCRLMIKSKYNQ